MEEKRIIDIALGEAAWTYSLKALHYLSLSEEQTALKNLWFNHQNQPSLFLIGFEENFKMFRSGYGCTNSITDVKESMLPMKAKKIDSFFEESDNPFNFLKHSMVLLKDEY